MELSPVEIPVNDSRGFKGAASDQDQGVFHRTPDQYSSTADQSNYRMSSNSASFPIFGASSAETLQPDHGGSSGAATTVTMSVIVDGPGRRAKALKSLKESIPHAMKLQNLQNSDRLYQKDGSWHKKCVRRLSKELYIIVSWYALLQSALFAAVAQTNMFTCEDSWGPVGIAAMVTLGTFKFALNKLCRIGDQQQQVRLFQARQNGVYDNIIVLLSQGSACNLDALEPESVAVSSQNPGLLFVFSTRGHLVLGFLVGFSALIIVSYLRMLRMLCGPACKCSSQ